MRDWPDKWTEEVHEKGADCKYWLRHFHRLALRGVLDVLEVLEKHWDGEISWESWTAPGLST